MAICPLPPAMKVKPPKPRYKLRCWHGRWWVIDKRHRIISSGRGRWAVVGYPFDRKAEASWACDKLNREELRGWLAGIAVAEAVRAGPGRFCDTLNRLQAAKPFLVDPLEGVVFPWPQPHGKITNIG